jgi:hypothetical protein
MKKSFWEYIDALVVASRYKYVSLIAGGFEKDDLNQTRSQ